MDLIVSVPEVTYLFGRLFCHSVLGDGGGRGGGGVVVGRWGEGGGGGAALRLPVGFPAHQGPSEKGSSLKGKEMTQREANSFLLEQTAFQKEATQFDRVASL